MSLDLLTEFAVEVQAEREQRPARRPALAVAGWFPNVPREPEPVFVVIPLPGNDWSLPKAAPPVADDTKRQQTTAPPPISWAPSPPRVRTPRRQPSPALERALACLRTEAGATVGQVADALEVSYQRALRLVRRLVAGRRARLGDRLGGTTTYVAVP